MSYREVEHATAKGLLHMGWKHTAKFARPRVLNAHLRWIVFLVLAGAVPVAGCGSVMSTAGDQVATATLQPVAACSNPPQNYTTGAYIWAIPAMGASNQVSVAQVCGLGFHPQASITLSLARYSSATFTPIPNLNVRTDDRGAFSSAIVVGTNWICLNLRIHADDGQGVSATTQLSPGGTPLPANTLPAGCPPPPHTP
jgi:hypothetical protein